MSRVKVYGIDQLDSISTEAWQALAEQSISINPFFEPWHLLPALRRFADPDVKLAIVEDRGDIRALLPVFPIKTAVFTGLKSWKHRHSFLSTPLFRDYDAVKTLVHGAMSQTGVDFFNLDHYGDRIDGVSDGPYNTSSFERPCQDLTIGWDEFMSRRSNRNRKEYRRILKKSDDNGLVHSESAAGDDVVRWLDEFMSLEASGWKGEQGSAIASDDNVLGYYRDVIDVAWPMEKIQFQKLSKEDRPVAVSFRFVSRGNCFEVKTSFDENARRLSPGLALELRNLESLFRSDNAFSDTCSSPDNQMLNRLWLDRRPIASTLIFHRTIRGAVAKMSYGSWRSYKHREQAAP